MTKRQSKVRLAVTIAAACSVAVGAVITGTPAYSEGRASRDVVQRELDGLVRDAGFPAALATYQDPRGRSRDYTAGVGDLETGARVPLDGQVRIGSNSKTFVAVALLQLVDEGSVDLDAPVETYLPGLVHGDGVDGTRITVRQVLQHTSGVPNYTAVMNLDFFATRHHYVEPRELLDLALTQPGTRAGLGVVVQQHQLRDRRPDRAEGHRPAARRGRHRARDRAAAPAGHLRAGPRRGGAARAPPARLPRVGARRRAARHHRARPVLGVGSGRHRLDPERPGRVLRRAARRRAAAARAPRGDADDRRDGAGAARHAVRAGALQHPAELRRRRLGARRQHPRVRDRRWRRTRRAVGDRRGDRAAGGHWPTPTRRGSGSTRRSTRCSARSHVARCRSGRCDGRPGRSGENRR